MAAEIEPLVMQIDKEAKLPDGIWKKLGDMGLMGLTVPEEYGGGGLDYLANMVAIEEMAKVCPALAVSYGVHTAIASENIYRNSNRKIRSSSKKIT